MTDYLSPSKRPGNKNDQIISYFTLRILIGAAGILLPFLVFLGKLISESSPLIEPSISDYYDNGAGGDIMVGVLFALAFFLFSYKGYDPVDNRAATIGALCALGVALFPTTSDVGIVHKLHFVFAFLLFSVFIFFSIYLFRKGIPGKPTTANKEKRNGIYLVCGIIMIICIAGIAVSSFWLNDAAVKYKLVFWLEAVALVSFGFSWITKAEFLFLKDAETEAKKAATKA
ncbi:MAG: hypothetical protein JNK14_17815 [Chitinophagaceae bacterium]|nr:hypothetical protein [Chitinophagaceae bacterium]